MKLLSLMILKKVSVSESWASEVIEEVFLTDEESERVEKSGL